MTYFNAYIYCAIIYFYDIYHVLCITILIYVKFSIRNSLLACISEFWLLFGWKLVENWLKIGWKLVKIGWKLRYCMKTVSWPRPVNSLIPIHKEGSKTAVGIIITGRYLYLRLFPRYTKNLCTVRFWNFLRLISWDWQNGFLPGRNYENSISESLNKRQIPLLLLIDFSVAFDMLDYSNFLKKARVLWDKRPYS